MFVYLFIYKVNEKWLNLTLKRRITLLFMSWQLNAKCDEVMWWQYCIVWNVYKVCFSYNCYRIIVSIQFILDSVNTCKYSKHYIKIRWKKLKYNKYEC